MEDTWVFGEMLVYDIFFGAYNHLEGDVRSLCHVCVPNSVVGTLRMALLFYLVLSINHFLGASWFCMVAFAVGMDWLVDAHGN